MSQKCVGCNMPHLQQLRGRRRRIGEGISSIHTYQLSRPFAPVCLKHATLEALHFPLMKIRGIKFLGQAFPHKRNHSTEVSAGLDLILQKSGRLMKTKTASQHWALYEVCAEVLSWVGCLHTSLLHHSCVLWIEWGVPSKLVLKFICHEEVGL